MKKALFGFVMAGVLTIGFTSCKKDYSCTCNYNWGAGDTTITYQYPKVSKSDAEETCDLQDTQIKIIDTNGSCSLD